MPRSSTARPTTRYSRAAARTVREFDLATELFDRFFAAMEADLVTTRYETWDDLCGYMDGSAAVIGEMLLPILAPTDEAAALPSRAIARAYAFQLTNFLRDIDDDLGLGRQYLPQAELRRFGVDLTERRVTPAFVELMRFQIDRCRHLYVDAAEGERWLPPRSERCVRTARRLYGAILDRIEDAGYDVFGGAHLRPHRREAAVGGVRAPTLIAPTRGRRRHPVSAKLRTWRFAGPSRTTVGSWPRSPPVCSSVPTATWPTSARMRTRSRPR